MERKYVEDERLSIILFLVIWTLYAVVYMTKNCYSAAMAALVSEGVLSKSQTGAISAVFYLVYAAFQVVGGVAADKFSAGKLVFIGVLGAALCNLVIYFNQNYIVMMVVWALNAVVQFGVWPGVFKIVSTQLAKEHRQRGVFYITLASSFGLILSYFCAAVVEKWQSNFSISAVLLFICAIGWLFFYQAVEKRMVLAEPKKTQAAAERKKPEGLPKLLLKSGVFLMLVAVLIQSVLNLGIKSLTPVMLMESYEHLSPSVSTALNIIVVIAGVVGSFLVRKLVLQRIDNEALSMAVLFLATLPLLLLVTFIGRMPALVIIIDLALIVLIMTGCGMLTQFISVRFGKFGCSGTVAGIFNAVAALGIVVSNYGFTKMAESMGWVATTYVWVLMAVIALVFVTIAIPLWKKMIQ